MYKHKKGGSFSSDTPSGAVAAAELTKIQEEFPGIQDGRARKHDILTGGKCTREVYSNYSVHQYQSKLKSQAKSRVKAKVKLGAKKSLGEIVDILGVDEVLDTLSNMKV